MREREYLEGLNWRREETDFKQCLLSFLVANIDGSIKQRWTSITNRVLSSFHSFLPTPMVTQIFRVLGFGFGGRGSLTKLGLFQGLFTNLALLDNFGTSIYY